MNRYLALISKTLKYYKRSVGLIGGSIAIAYLLKLYLNKSKPRKVVMIRESECTEVVDTQKSDYGLIRKSDTMNKYHATLFNSAESNFVESTNNAAVVTLHANTQSDPASNFADCLSTMNDTNNGVNCGPKLSCYRRYCDFLISNMVITQSSGLESSSDSGLSRSSPDVCMQKPQNICPQTSSVQVDQYDFEIPHTLVGLIIGKDGKNIKFVSKVASVRITVRPRHYNRCRAYTHQLCEVNGLRQNINRALNMIRRRFPVNRFPDLNLDCIFDLARVSHGIRQTRGLYGDEELAFGRAKARVAPAYTLCLEPEKLRPIFISSVVSPNSIFLQNVSGIMQLSFMEQRLTETYEISSNLESFIVPPSYGTLCAVERKNPSNGLMKWHRVVVVGQSESDESVCILYIDYGGFEQFRFEKLFRLREDFSTIPSFAHECTLSTIKPVNETAWEAKVIDRLKELVCGEIVFAQLTGHRYNRCAIQLYTLSDQFQVNNIEEILIKEGLAAFDQNVEIPKFDLNH